MRLVDYSPPAARDCPPTTIGDNVSRWHRRRTAAAIFVLASVLMLVFVEASAANPSPVVAAGRHLYQAPLPAQQLHLRANVAAGGNWPQPPAGTVGGPLPPPPPQPQYSLGINNGGHMFVLDSKGRPIALLPGLLDETLLNKGSFAFGARLVKFEKLKVLGNVYVNRVNGLPLREAYLLKSTVNKRSQVQEAQLELTDGGSGRGAAPQQQKQPLSGATQTKQQQQQQQQPQQQQKTEAASSKIGTNQSNGGSQMRLQIIGQPVGGPMPN